MPAPEDTIMLALILALMADAAEPEPGMKIIARGEWPRVRGSGRQALAVREPLGLIRSLSPYTELAGGPRERIAARAAGDLAAALKVKEIDWSRQMAIIILAGERPAGHRVEVTWVGVVKGVMKVRWKLHAPPAAGRGKCQPGEVVIVPRFAGPVIFDPPLGK
jgi:hypothetical protein